MASIRNRLLMFSFDWCSGPTEKSFLSSGISELSNRSRLWSRPQKKQNYSIRFLQLSVPTLIFSIIFAQSSEKTTKTLAGIEREGLLWTRLKGIKICLNCGEELTFVIWRNYAGVILRFAVFSLEQSSGLETSFSPNVARIVGRKVCFKLSIYRCGHTSVCYISCSSDCRQNCPDNRMLAG